MLIKTSDYCKTQSDLDVILRKLKDMNYGLRLGIKLDNISDYSYLCILNNEIIGILQADIFANSIYEVEVFKFRNSNTFSMDLLRFYKLLSNLNPNRLKFTVSKNNTYAEKLALKMIKKYFKQAEMIYFIPDEDKNVYVYKNTKAEEL